MVIQPNFVKIFISRLFYLSARPKWHGTSKVRLDDVVLFWYTDCDKTGWKIGRVVEILKKGELLLSYSCQPVLSKSKDPNFTLTPLNLFAGRCAMSQSWLRMSTTVWISTWILQL